MDWYLLAPHTKFTSVSRGITALTLFATAPINTITMSTNSNPLRIGMIGAGVVGGGVYEIIMNRLGSSSAANTNTPVITKICVRDASKPRDFHIDPSKTEVVTDVNSIVNDVNIDLVVEVMGGVGIAKDAVMESLKRGKSVVTANSMYFSTIPSSLFTFHRSILNVSSCLLFK